MSIRIRPRGRYSGAPPIRINNICVYMCMCICVYNYTDVHAYICLSVYVSIDTDLDGAKWLDRQIYTD